MEKVKITHKMNHQQEAERLINLHLNNLIYYYIALDDKLPIARKSAIITVNEILNKLNVDSKLIADYIKVKQILEKY